ncbi:hypothetical protein BDQ17DRAFT_1548480 [Cyathus striatus]|nr:hypothetical protein BDQ17DRAFT_1548480 [Cyathus striatus]
MTTPLNLENLQTESRNASSDNIDVVSTLELCRIINASDHEITPSITRCIPQIAQCIDMIVPRVRGGGRVIYVGAGTSGRLGVLDASEITPTFSSPDIFHAIIAGTDLALRNAIEGAEDLPFEFPPSFAPLTSTDTLIGIATSGRTPYVLSALSYARAHGALALGLAFVSPSEIRERGDCEVVVECVVGGEVLMGSTRMKAGSGTKMILNMISTGVMIRLGKTYGNLMIDLKPTNTKLLLRAVRIFRTILPHSPFSNQEIEELVGRGEGTGGGWGGLRGAWGDLPVNDVEVVGEEVGEVKVNEVEVEEERVVLCVDAGGTKCSAIIQNKRGTVGRAVGGPCNFVTLGHEVALTTLKSLIDQAVSSYTAASASDSGKPTASKKRNVKVKVAAAWIGGAGLDRMDDVRSVKERIAGLLGMVREEDKVVVSSDAALLGAAISSSRVSTGMASGTSAAAGVQTLTSPSTSTGTTVTISSPVTSNSPTTATSTATSTPSTTPPQTPISTGTSSSSSITTTPSSETSTSTSPETTTSPATSPQTSPETPSSLTQDKTQIGAVLVLGTGSIAASFSLSPLCSPPFPNPLKRTGGWGYLLGDEGSAYDIGREAIRALLTERDNGRALSVFMKSVVKCLGCDEVEVVSAVYDPARGVGDPKLRVASVCRVVFEFAFPSSSASSSVSASPSPSSYPVALDIVQKAAKAAARTLLPLFSGPRKIVPSESTLVMGGALCLMREYREMVLDALKGEGYVFERVVVVDDVPAGAVGVLVRWVL